MLSDQDSSGTKEKLQGIITLGYCCEYMPLYFPCNSKLHLIIPMDEY